MSGRTERDGDGAGCPRLVVDGVIWIAAEERGGRERCMGRGGPEWVVRGDEAFVGIVGVRDRIVDVGICCGCTGCGKEGVEDW